nr:PREDICTED: uncharacterized protein LOC103546566 isoform X2 [Equus przewalskii]
MSALPSAARTFSQFPEPRGPGLRRFSPAYTWRRQDSEIWELRAKEEALEAQVRQLERELEVAPRSETAEDAEDWDVEEARPVHARLVIQQKVKHEQLLGPGGVTQGAPIVTEFTAYSPYMPTELRGLCKQCGQWPGEPIPAWLLQLWDEGAGSIVCTPGPDGEASLHHVAPLPQPQQNSRRLAQGHGKHSMVE